MAQGTKVLDLDIDLELSLSASTEACQKFKTQVSDSLPLLRFLNDDDKENVWKFWKTVSSAVKIAVNGKGDVSSVYKTSAPLALLNESGHECFVKGNAPAKFVHVKNTDTDLGKYRLLKVANEKNLSDCTLTIPLSEEVNNDKRTTQREDICDVIGETLKTHSGCEEVLKHIHCFINHHDVSTSQKGQSAHDLTYVESVKGHSQGRSKQSQWPVGIPTTRSMSKSKSISILSATNDENIMKQKAESEAKSSFSFTKEHFTHTQYQTKYFLSKTSDKAEYNVTLLPVNDTQVTKIGETENSSVIPCPDKMPEKNHNIVIDVEPALYHNISNNLQPQQEICSSKSEDNSGDLPELQTMKNSIKDTSPASQTVQIKTEESGLDDASQTELDIKPIIHEMHQVHVESHLLNRCSSDIETIISALEAELRKNGTDVGSISVSSAKEGTSEIVTDSNYGPRVVQFVHGHEVTEIQNGEDVVWTSGEEVHVTGPQSTIDTSTVEDKTAMDVGGIAPHLDVQCDVVEYEVFADKEKMDGTWVRKKKNKNICQEKDILDRTCPMCHRVLTYASSMAAHMRIHTGDRPYCCGQCDRKFTTKANRDRHEATHVGLKPFKCTECEKSFTEKRSLKIHMRSHTGERPFVCTVCGRGFAQKCTLLVHMDRHTNKKGHLCDLCGKAFRQKCQLDIHVKRHNRQANYPCTQCSVKCYTKGDLTRHKIKHTGERPFQCNVCSRTFTRKQYLMDHENTHYGRKPYKCSICPQAFHDVGSCHRHLRKHRHEEEKASHSKSKRTTLLSTDDYNIVLKGTQTGQVLTLEDGSKAMIKSVESESDGSIVYHISCVGNDLVNNESKDVNY